MGELRITEILADGQRWLFALETIAIDRYRDGWLCGLRARLELQAVIVIENGAGRALGIDGRELPLASLTEQFPTLQSLLPAIVIQPD